MRAVLLVVFAGMMHAHARAADQSESAIKAAFLHRFAAYVQWPARDEEGPFTIGVFGAEEIARELERTLPSLNIRDQMPRVRRVSAPTELDGVHVLYIGQGQIPKARRILRTASRAPILIVTDGPDGLEHGGIINFVSDGGGVRLEVSLPAAERAGLRVDSGLLAIAARVVSEP